MEFRDFLGGGTDAVGRVSGDEEVDVGGVVFPLWGVGGVGVDAYVPVVLAGRGKGTMGEMGSVG